jgi:uncharacterized protein (TIGR03435 family)
MQARHAHRELVRPTAEGASSYYFPMPSLRRPRLHLRRAILTVAAAIALAAIPLVAQTPAAAPMPTGAFSQPPSADPITYAPALTFDIASIHELQPDADNPSWAIGLVSPPHSCQFQAKAHAVKVLIQLAYGFSAFEISGGPDWINTSLYNVDAKCDHSVDEQFARYTDDQAKLEKEHMLQALLADRFHLKAHWETRQANVYALELANPNSGSKLQPAKVETADPSIPNAPPPETPGPDIQSRSDAHGRVMTVRYLTAKGMAGLFGAMLHATVEDKTALPGRYDFTLNYTYQSTDPDAYPPLLTALEAQLGLKLQRTRGSMDIFVIDHIDKPTEN